MSKSDTPTSGSPPPEQQSSQQRKKISADDVLALYRRGIVSAEVGCHREAFRYFDAVCPFLGADAMVWIRLCESIIHTLYEPVELSFDYVTVMEHQFRSWGAYRKARLGTGTETNIDANVLAAERITLEYAGQAATIAVDLLSKTNQYLKLAHAYHLQSFCSLKQGRYRMAEQALLQLAVLIRDNMEAFAKNGRFKNEMLMRANLYKTQVKLMETGSMETVKMSLALLGSTTVLCDVFKRTMLADCGGEARGVEGASEGGGSGDTPVHPEVVDQLWNMDADQAGNDAAAPIGDAPLSHTQLDAVEVEFSNSPGVTTTDATSIYVHYSDGAPKRINVPYTGILDVRLRRLNLALVHAAVGNTSLAYDQLKQLDNWLCPVAHTLGVYCLMKMNRLEEAQKLLKTGLMEL